MLFARRERGERQKGGEIEKMGMAWPLAIANSRLMRHVVS